jgi:hypothetical protein
MVTVDFIAFIWGVHAATKPASKSLECKCECQHVSPAVSKHKHTISPSGYSFITCTIIKWFWILYIVCLFFIFMFIIFKCCVHTS